MKKYNMGISNLRHRIRRCFSIVAQENFSFIKFSSAKLVTFTIALALAACSGGGGGGGGGEGAGNNSGGGSSSGSGSSPQGFVVSGVVSAPGGAVAFLPPKSLFQQFADTLISSAYAISGITPVADGTTVELVRINNNGAVISVLAATTTSGGSYSFNLTTLGLSTASDLVVQVKSLSSGVRMRAFVVAETVNLDTISETATQIVLETIAAPSGLALTNFTIQELMDITNAINLLVTVQGLSGGVDVETTVTAFKAAVTVEVDIMSFVSAAAASGQSSRGPGDIGNYFPFGQGNRWVYQGIEESGGTIQNYTNTRRITGTKIINGTTTTVFHESNPANSGSANEDYIVKDNQAITNYGNNDTADFLTPQLTPYRQYAFPLGLNSSFESINKPGLTWSDEDFDGTPEIASLKVSVTVVGFETITVSAGTYANAAKLVVNTLLSIALSGDGTNIVIEDVTTEWYAPGVGLVKSVGVTQTTAYGVTDVSTITEELSDFSMPLTFSAISAGLDHTCGLTIEGAAYCWGNNFYGQFGNGTNLNSSTTPVAVTNGLTFKLLAAGGNYTCGLTTDGEAYCWGLNVSGQFGNGTTVSSTVPVPTSGGLTFASISVQGAQTCGVTTIGEGYCWGRNSSSGSFGNGSLSSSLIPVAVSGGLVFSFIGVGSEFACGLTTNGKAYCWGDNFVGNLGDGSSANSAIPIVVSGGIVFSSLSVGSHSVCGITLGGVAYCWGRNHSGQLGDGSTANSSVPVAVSGGFLFDAISIGDTHACGIAVNRAAYCWGSNSSGQLGNGIISNSTVTTPVSVSGGLTFTSLDVGMWTYSCGVAAGGLGYCWGGSLTSSMLGNGTGARSSVPALVVPPL